MGLAFEFFYSLANPGTAFWAACGGEVFTGFPINTLLSCTPVVELPSDHNTEALNLMTPYIIVHKKSTSQMI